MNADGDQYIDARALAGLLDVSESYAYDLRKQGRSPAYVQRQLGRASIALTVDVYGKWLPMADKGAADALDDDAWRASGSKCERYV